VLRTSNMTKFPEPCFTNGFPLEDIFLRKLKCSIARVAHANTVLALIKWAGIPAPTTVSSVGNFEKPWMRTSGSGNP